MTKKAKRGAGLNAPKAAAADGSVSAWEDDPGSGVIVNRPVPELGKTPLAFAFPRAPAKAGVYPQGTAEFRYWTAAEALRRGADYWAKCIPLTNWEVGPTLKVILDEGTDLNAYYDRAALNFFHGPAPEAGTVYSGESPDIVCHEMGHAVLDSFKPQLWSAGSQEVAAFHESFADISALLSAIQLPSLRADILTTTGGALYRSSRLSRLAEQLGAAIRAQSPDAVDSDCLRNAVNSFTYQDPKTLPSSAPASQLSSEPHSFSRVFTGAFFEMLGAALTAKAADAQRPTDLELVTVSDDLARILVEGIKAAPVVANWYAQVASSMVLAAGGVDEAYGPIIKAVFVRRAILSLHSATAMAQFSQVRAAVVPPGVTTELPVLGITATHYGIDGLLFLESAAQPRAYLVTAAATDASPLDQASGSAAAQEFADDLFTRGRVDCGDIVQKQHRLEHGERLKTHRLKKCEGGAKLERVLFDCGLCKR